MEELLGPPDSGSCWYCPLCQAGARQRKSRQTRDHIRRRAEVKAALSCLPPLPGYKVKFKCHKCDWFGDQLDLVEYVHNDWSRKEACEFLKAKWEEYYRLIADGGTTLGEADKPVSPEDVVSSQNSEPDTTYQSPNVVPPPEAFIKLPWPECMKAMDAWMERLFARPKIDEGPEIRWPESICAWPERSLFAEFLQEVAEKRQRLLELEHCQMSQRYGHAEDPALEEEPR
jgi:hypothetical protein